MHRSLNAANRTDAIDGSQMMFMPMRKGLSPGQFVTERSAVQICFHIVGREGIAAKKDVNKPLFDQPGECIAPTGVNDGRSTGQ